ncbi:hypothetical protein SAMN04515656_11217 [Eubacterium aggregans]|uniref:Uncharacterized protein n=1 Tax=Eubacterium aggregans TaxID=81409 RepID=A0A1H4BNN1_9FIRM|nr:hypothetical protein [Eubacterium aggregans]SEA49785.1 hypothetical protein SAMN04515656_11217 [Eubacterium aggregans]
MLFIFNSPRGAYLYWIPLTVKYNLALANYFFSVALMYFFMATTAQRNQVALSNSDGHVANVVRRQPFDVVDLLRRSYLTVLAGVVVPSQYVGSSVLP